VFQSLRKLYVGQTRKLDLSTKKLLRNSGWVAVSGIGTTVLAAAQSIIAVRFLGVETYGLLAMIGAIAGFVFQFADFRTWEVGVRFLPEKIKEGDHEGVIELTTALLSLDVISGFIALSITWLLREWLAQTIAPGFEIVSLLSIFAFALPMIQISYGTCVGVLRAFDKFNIISIKIFAFVLLQLVVVTTVLLLNGTIWTVIISMVICEALHAIASLILIFITLRQNAIEFPKKQVDKSTETTLAPPQFSCSSMV
jgi:O-antigen/teichoic acid export membrane protein